MTEDPIKLFATRAERLPQPDDGDTLRAAIEKGIEQVPVAGPITTFVASRFWAPSASRRLEEWLKEFADDFDKHCEGCKVENLVNDEVFISASIQVARIVVGTHQEEKRRFLRNALLNVAMGKRPDDGLQQIFLNAVEEFTPAHIKVLKVLWCGVQDLVELGLWEPHVKRYDFTNYRQAIEALVPELKGQEDFVQYIMTDLRNRGFSRVGGSNTSFPESPGVTNMGGQFLDFVLKPEDLPK